MSFKGHMTDKKLKYKDGRTKQSFKDACDIKKILEKFSRTGTISHIQKYGGQYGDFAGLDFFDAQVKLAQGQQIFDQLPAEIRREFQWDPGQFFAFVNDPANVDKLEKVLPDLAKPGRQLPVVRNTVANVTKEETPPTEPAPATASPDAGN